MYTLAIAGCFQLRIVIKPKPCSGIGPLCTAEQVKISFWFIFPQKFNLAISFSFDIQDCSGFLPCRYATMFLGLYMVYGLQFLDLWVSWSLTNRVCSGELEINGVPPLEHVSFHFFNTFKIWEPRGIKSSIFCPVNIQPSVNRWRITLRLQSLMASKACIRLSSHSFMRACSEWKFRLLQKSLLYSVHVHYINHGSLSTPSLHIVFSQFYWCLPYDA